MNKIKISYGPYLNETYHGNYRETQQRPIERRVEGILIIYNGNIFNLKDYRSCEVDKDGNPIK